MSVEAMGRGMAAEADANIGVEVNTAVSVLFLASCFLPLMEAYSSILNTDQWNYFTATEETLSDPQYGAQSAEDYQQYQVDSAGMDEDTGALSNLMDQEQSVAQSAGNAMGPVYQQAEGETQLQRFTVSLIAKMMNI